MPELPEVESVVRSLRPHVGTMREIRVVHVRADMIEPAGFDLTTALKDRTLVDVARRAKRIVFTLDTGDVFFIHLGMTGQLTLESPDTALKPHTHLRAKLSSGLELRLVDPRRFGAIVWLGDAGHRNVGPEPLVLRTPTLVKILANTRRAIKVALLDQTLIAGIGNIYADESLHRAKIDPRRLANTLSAEEIGRLNRSIKQVLRRAIAAGGSSIRDYVDGNGNRGWFQISHRVYDREGEPCRSCKKSIIRIVLGGRSTHFCESCQS